MTHTTEQHRCCHTCTAAVDGSGRLKVKTVVKIERDESRWPSKGTWPQFRGKTATIISVRVENLDDDTTGTTAFHVEYGLALKKTQHIDAWFLPHEVTAV